MRAHGQREAWRLHEAVGYCTAITREHSSTFFLGSRLFRGERRRAVTVVYAACRLGDDAVDEAPHPAEAARRLEAWWASIARAACDDPRPHDPLEVALAWVFRRFPVPLEGFRELYLGLRSDIGHEPIRDVDELMRYCYRVAGVVGLLVAPIAGYRGGEDTLRSAVALGNAMQLTNVLRDVGEDLCRGRCYLPADRLRAHGVSLEALRSGEVTPGYVALLEELATRAHELYREGWRGIPRLQGASAAAVGVAALNYQGILRKLEQNRYDNLTRRAYLRPIERLATIPRALVGLVVPAP